MAATTAIAKMDTLKDFLLQNRSKIEAVLPRHVKGERVLQLAFASISRQPELLQCSQTSILRCLLDASQLGLELNNALGFAYILPYRTKAGGYVAQMIPGYRGLCKIARNSGEIQNIEATTVYPGEPFHVTRGTNSGIDHVPDYEVIDQCLKDGIPLRAVYAVGYLREGRPQFEVMIYRQIEAIRQRSKAASAGPWHTDFEEMAKKTVVRRLCKMLPVSVELATALAMEDRAEGDDSAWTELGIEETVDAEGPATAVPELTSTDRLKDRLRQSRLPTIAHPTAPHTETQASGEGQEPSAPEGSPTGQREGDELTDAMEAETVAVDGPGDQEHATVDQLDGLAALAAEVSEAAVVEVTALRTRHRHVALTVYHEVRNNLSRQKEEKAKAAQVS